MSDFVGGTSNGSYMKKGFFFLFAFIVFGIVACDNDDDEFVTPAGAVINEENAEASEYNNAQLPLDNLHWKDLQMNK